VSSITEPGVYPDIPDGIYHGDPVLGGSLSSTGAKRILDSPARYQWELTHRVEKVAFDVGHAVHALVLGVGMGVEVVKVTDKDGTKSDATDYRTKSAQEHRDAIYAAGDSVPLLRKDLAPIEAMADAVLTHPIAGPLLERPGQSEASLFAPDPESGVWLRARPDRLPDQDTGQTTVVDLKTARSADPRAFNRSAADFGYDIQRAFYTHTLRLARGDEDAAFVFIVVETEAPHLVSVIELDDEFTAIGRARMRRAIDTFKACRDADEWPGYEPVVHLVDAPRWLAYEEGMVL
jgi:hypothetical protein